MYKSNLARIYYLTKSFYEQSEGIKRSTQMCKHRMFALLKRVNAEKTLTNLRGASTLTGEGAEMMTSWSGLAGDMIDGGQTEAFTS